MKHYHSTSVNVFAVRDVIIIVYYAEAAKHKNMTDWLNVFIMTSDKPQMKLQYMYT